jgi:hypothetical protein
MTTTHFSSDNTNFGELSFLFVFARHRFFPILKFMVEKCEQATWNAEKTAKRPGSDQSPAASSKKPGAGSSFESGSPLGQPPAHASSFEQDLKRFVLENEAVLSEQSKASSSYWEQLARTAGCSSELTQLYEDLDKLVNRPLYKKLVCFFPPGFKANHSNDLGQKKL